MAAEVAVFGVIVWEPLEPGGGWSLWLDEPRSESLGTEGFLTLYLVRGLSVYLNFRGSNLGDLTLTSGLSARYLEVT